MIKRCLVLTLTIALCLIAATATADEDWSYTISPYLWFAGMDGQVSTLPSLPPADVDASFSDVVGNLDMALFIAGEVRKGRWGLVADVAYVDLEAEGDTPGPLYSAVELGATNWMVSAMGLYRVHDGDGPFVDIVAGFRYWDVSSDLTLRAGALPELRVDNGESWFDPVIGAKGLSALGESKFSFGWHAILGGFGAGSDMMWDLRANFGYQFGDHTSAILGYRYLDVDYDDDDFLYDITQDGPILGLVWRF